MKRFLSILLSLGLALYLADAAISLLDDSAFLAFGAPIFSLIRGMVFLPSAIMGIVIYALIGLTPMIPKRFFLPIVLFNPLAMLGVIPISIYHHDAFPRIAWTVSLLQTVFGLCVLWAVQGGVRFRWPLVAEEQLGRRIFGWWNLSGFVLVNALVVLPGACLYLAYCASVAVDHFSGGFVVLRPDGLSVRAKTYGRADGKTIRLIPMMHIGESLFYRQVSQSLPTNSVSLLEGVTDRNQLLKHELTYKRMATSLGLSEQQEEFTPTRSAIRHADIDVAEFSEGTIELLNLITLIHSKGLNSETLLQLMQKSQDSVLADQLWDDLLTKRNDYLLEKIEETLPDWDVIVVPWGAAHMRGLAQGIQASGFESLSAQEFQVVNFRTVWSGLGRPRE